VLVVTATMGGENFDPTEAVTVTKQFKHRLFAPQLLRFHPIRHSYNCHNGGEAGVQV